MSEHAHPKETVPSDRDWVAFAGPPLGLGRAVVCRLAEVDGRVRIVELQLDGGGQPVAGSALRQLPISAMERVAGSVIRADGPKPDGQTLEVMWSLEDLRRILSDAPVPQWSDAALPGPPPIVLFGRANDQLTYVMKHDPPLDWSKGQVLTDAFLHSVGGAYDAAIQRGESPAKSIAEATGASQKTVQSWVYQGRKKGVIAPAQGKGRIK